MNDFTKEELRILSEYLDYPIEEIAGCESNRLQLSLKIQSKIDNYCEHQDRVSSSDDEGHMVVQCGRCDRVLWHEKD